MRKAMQSTVENILEQNEDTILLMIDIGAYNFRNFIKKCPERARNIGIFEPGTISVAAGLALAGMTPIVYGISPFIVQRSLEQLKLDFVYQNIGGNFITTGASYDFSTLGYSHFCPEDFATLRLLPGMEIVTPGTPSQFKTLFEHCCYDGKPTYFRMTDHCNTFEVDVEFAKASVIKRGNKATVIAVAELLDETMKACEDLDVTILYYTTLAPFDRETLLEEAKNRKIFVVSPFYKGSLDSDIISAFEGTPCSISSVEVPLEVMRTYGRKAEKDAFYGLTSEGIRNKLIKFIQ